VGKEACLHILLGTYQGLASFVYVSVLLPRDLHVSNLLTHLPEK
jgi:hypothetical protein